jgi:hypothetical protein
LEDTVRKAKDNSHVPNRYYRPEVKHCPICGRALKRRYVLWDKYVITLDGRLHIYNLAYGCPEPTCAGAQRIFASDEANRLSLKGSSFGVALIVQVGWWRFWQHKTIDEILAEFEARRLPLSRRHVLNLIVDFLALLRAAQPAKIDRHRSYFKRHGLTLSIDAMEPEKGNDLLYVVREITFGLTLNAENLVSGNAQAIQTQILAPVQALGFKVRAIVSDAEESIRCAARATWPGRPHQACQWHCLREASKPIFAVDSALKSALQREIRAKLTRIRRKIGVLEPDDPFQPALVAYSEAIRLTLRTESLPPFQLSGVQIVQDLRGLGRSMRRCAKKRAIRC